MSDNNIWSKVTANSARANKPVLVFFYGGREYIYLELYSEQPLTRTGFAIGNTNSPLYTGKYFADAENIVFVTFNYRLNIYGFPGAAGETANLGHRDQRAAVKWVRDYIGRFGSNPSKVTVSVQSSGGVAIDYWTYTYKKDPIVNGIIASSGNAFSFPANTATVQEQS